MKELEKMIELNNEMLEDYLSPYACKSSDAIRMKRETWKNEFNVRNDFSRDADRILHSTAYTRYMDKTQVFSLFNNIFSFYIQKRNIIVCSYYIDLIIRFYFVSFLFLHSFIFFLQERFFKY